MHSHFVESHPIRILEDGPLISEVVLSHSVCSLAAEEVLAAFLHKRGGEHEHDKAELRLATRGK
jgi:hypothetical protein